MESPIISFDSMVVEVVGITSSSAALDKLVTTVKQTAIAVVRASKSIRVASLISTN